MENTNEALNKKLDDILDSNISQDEKLNKLSDFIDMYGNDYLNQDKNVESDSEHKDNGWPHYDEKDDCCADNLDYEEDDNYDVPCLEDYYMDDVELKIMYRAKVRKDVEEMINRHENDKQGLINEIAEMILDYEF